MEGAGYRAEDPGRIPAQLVVKFKTAAAASRAHSTPRQGNADDCFPRLRASLCAMCASIARDVRVDRLGRARDSRCGRWRPSRAGASTPWIRLSR